MTRIAPLRISPRSTLTFCRGIRADPYTETDFAGMLVCSHNARIARDTPIPVHCRYNCLVSNGNRNGVTIVSCLVHIGIPWAHNDITSCNCRVIFTVIFRLWNSCPLTICQSAGMSSGATTNANRFKLSRIRSNVRVLSARFSVLVSSFSDDEDDDDDDDDQDDEQSTLFSIILDALDTALQIEPTTKQINFACAKAVSKNKPKCQYGESPDWDIQFFDNGQRKYQVMK
eukprot:TRINITY_DN1597_c1_g1_i5.p1 TRINITY_DN1597_c1_g1~~TRINITY_DN1597_c1_g1_i5.p1  ORF type:complete len:229 (-),score=48.84 TRINITY_DN1597_c1_g1_i5:170-856(-)